MTGRLKQFFYDLRKTEQYRDFCLAHANLSISDRRYIDALNGVNESIGAFVSEIMYNNWKNCTPAELKKVEGTYLHEQVGIAVESARNQASNIIPEWYQEKIRNGKLLDGELKTPFPI